MAPAAAEGMQERLFKAPESLKCALNIAKELHARRGGFAKTVKGLLATPPSGGIEYEAHILEQAFEDQWRELKDAMAKEDPTAPDGVHKDEAAAASTKDTVQDQEQAEPKESASSLQAEAAERADGLIQQYINAVYPMNWSEAVLSGVLKGQQNRGRFR